jgi:hypothetical protein
MRILHIFRKDVRRLAAPLLALVVIEATAAYCETQSYLSGPSRSSYYRSQSTLLLLTFAWIFLIAAVILQERLPGTRQYWLTRPIGWPRLLAAKLLFVAVFVNAFWFLSDCVILGSLHLPIDPPLLLFRQIPLTVILFLPAFCLASISSGLGQIAMGLMMAAFGFVFAIVAPTLFQSHNSRSTSFIVYNGSAFVNWPWIALTALTLLIITLQFARRSTLTSRLLFLIPLFCLIPITLFETMAGAFLSRPVLSPVTSAQSAPAIAISFDLDSGRRPTSVSADAFNGLQLPIQIQNLPPGVYVEGAGTADLTDHSNRLAAFLYSDRAGRWLRLYLRNQLPPGQVPVEASLAISTFKVEKTQIVSIQGNKIFSPAASVYCRSYPSTTPQFLCWSGPQQRQRIQYRAFLGVDQTSPALSGVRPELFYERRLPWTFSPVDSWTLLPPNNTAAPDSQALFLTLSPANAVDHALRAQNIDLTQYLVKP